MLKFRFFATGTYEDWSPTYQGGISFNTAGSISSSVMWKLSPGKLPFPLFSFGILSYLYNSLITGGDLF